jgi:putative NADH-flavin reductase
MSKVQRRAFIATVVLGLGMAGCTGRALVEDAPSPPRARKALHIAVYGGSGAIGSRIVNEALARGHYVTIVDRNPKPVAGADPKRLTIIKGDAFDVADIGRNLQGNDALVMAVAVRPAPWRDFYERMVKAAVTAQRQQVGRRKTRLMVVGGGSSLLTPEGKRMVDTYQTIPDAYRNEVLSSIDALNYLRTVTDTAWTFLSPNMNIEPGVRTGKFRLGIDTVLTDAQGKSGISMEDYAVAMVDEIERPKNIRRRFVVGY